MKKGFKNALSVLLSLVLLLCIPIFASAEDVKVEYTYYGYDDTYLLYTIKNSSGTEASLTVGENIPFPEESEDDLPNFLDAGKVVTPYVVSVGEVADFNPCMRAWFMQLELRDGKLYLCDDIWENPEEMYKFEWTEYGEQYPDNPEKEIRKLYLYQEGYYVISGIEVGNGGILQYWPRGARVIHVVDNSQEPPVDDPTPPADDPVDEPDPITPTTQFKDVPADAYYADAVQWAVENGITQGTSADKFSPNSSCTRAQAVTFLWRAAGSPKVEGATGFSDVSDSAYYADAVKWAVANGITQGTGGGKFSPNATCNRAQIVTFMYRAEGSPAVSGNNSFGDVGTNAYYNSAVQWAVQNGITQGTTTTSFSPDNDCVRAQIVTFLYRGAK